MKKIFMNLSAGTTFAVAIALASCNNAEQVKKQVEEQNAKIQTAVDEKLNGLAETVNAECTAKVDSLANVAYAAWVEEEAAAAKKGGKKLAPKPKPQTKKEEPKKDPQKERAGGATTKEEIQKQRNSDPKKTELENQKKRN